MKTDWSWATQLKRAHRDAWAEGWQYCTVWRHGPPGNRDGYPEAPLPDESGGRHHWELNVDREDDGYSVTIPKWSDGSTVTYAVHYRRPFKGMTPSHLKAHLYEQRDKPGEDR